MRITGKGLAAVGLLAVLAAGAVYAELAGSGYIERRAVQTATGASSTQSSRMYWKGDSLRTEMYTVDGQMVQIKKGDTVISYSPVLRKGSRVVQKGMPSLKEIIKGETTLPKGLKKIGTGTVAGCRCNVYTPVKKDSRIRSAKLYVNVDPRMPIIMKREIVTVTGHAVEEVRTLRLGGRISDSLFQVPKGVQIKDVKIPSAPAKGKGSGK